MKWVYVFVLHILAVCGSNGDPDAGAGQWGEWSEWSPCSHSCNGGATRRVRSCNGESCVGDAIAYRICNIKSCPEGQGTVDDRAALCSEYNHRPYRGHLYEWEPEWDAEDPCALTCRPIGFSFVAKLAPRVPDGTRCRPGALDMCVSGVCMAVGCDLELGSTKAPDRCGICGGDGSTCDPPEYRWNLPNPPIFSTCSTTCGGGYQVNQPICKNQATGHGVSDKLCDLSTKPRLQIRACNVQKCPAKWVTETWGPCSASCGGGVQQRPVYCVREGGSRDRVDPSHCPRRARPLARRPCNFQACPVWLEGPWSGCSATCGQGFQTRAVECVDGRGQHNDRCDPQSRPPDRHQCSPGIPCPQEDRHLQDDSPLPHYSLPWVQKLINSPNSTEPNFAVGEWGPCSVTCGKGSRSRQIYCKIFLEFSRTEARLPDSKCPGLKPAESEPCFLQPCALDQNKASGIEVTYSWKTTGYTPCSASCLGGIKESIIQCIRDHDQAVVSSTHCDIRQKHDSVIHTCNDHPCEPRWNVSEFGPCSKTCGSGEQIRQVQCVHEVTRGAANALIVPNDLCPQPPPRNQQFCNVLDCPASWVAGPWSKCSQSCGGGFKTRKIKCQKDKAHGQTSEQSPSSCPKKKPRTVKNCNNKPCHMGGHREGVDPRPEILESNQKYVQSKVQDKVYLKVGGSASVFQGAHVKIRCPTRKRHIANSPNSLPILWLKDGEQIEQSKKFKVSRKGVLRIRQVGPSDAGTYTCSVGSAKADLQLTVREPPFDPQRSFVPPPPSKTPLKYKIKQIKELMQNPFNVTSTTKSIDHHTEDGPQTSSSQRPPIPDFIEPEEPVQVYDPWGDKFPHHADYHQVQRYPPPSTLSPPPPLSHWSYGDLVGDQGPSGDSPISSGASHPLPHIHQLLSNLQHTLGGPPAPGATSGSFVLGKGRPESLEFDWVASEWGPCTQACGGSEGLQTRSAQCLVTLHNVSRSVDANLCEDAGLTPPPTVRPCGRVDCPRWESGPWSQCIECFTWRTAVQRREVSCHAANGSHVDASQCDPATKPRRRRECPSEKCTGVWKVGDWSECTVTCGTRGFQSRILRCVWFGTERAAGHACRDQPRPPVMRHCRGPPCEALSNCVDKSKYCSLARNLQMCRLAYYHEQCCISCRRS